MGDRREYRDILTLVMVGATCDNCGRELEFVWSDYLISGMPMRDALRITLAGGYGAYFDGNDIGLVFCKECADKLIVEFPCFAVTQRVGEPCP